jgi:hypothetical protein
VVVTVRTFLAFPLFYLVSRAPEVVGAIVALNVVAFLSYEEMTLPAFVMVLTCGLLSAVLVVVAAGALPLLPMTNGGRRTLRDVCWQAADAVATWARWPVVLSKRSPPRHQGPKLADRKRRDRP